MNKTFADIYGTETVSALNVTGVNVMDPNTYASGLADDTSAILYRKNSGTYAETWSNTGSVETARLVPNGKWEEGWYQFKVKAYDNVRNASVYNSKEFLVDLTPPQVTNMQTAYGWTNKNVTVNPTATDPVSNGVRSGVAGLKIVNQGTSAMVTSASSDRASATLSAEQNQEYYVEAFDHAGNASTRYKFTVKIDKTPPTASMNKSLSLVYNKASAGQLSGISLTVSDPGSDVSGLQAGSKVSVYYKENQEDAYTEAWKKGGIETGERKVPDSVWKNADGSYKDGYYKVAADATDNAGNTLTKTLGEFLLDTRVPEFMNMQSAYGWTNQDVTVTPIAVDKYGIRQVKVCKPDGSVLDQVEMEDRISMTFTAEQNQAYRVEATDEAGNTSTFPFVVKIDKTQPKAQVSEPGYSPTRFVEIAALKRHANPVTGIPYITGSQSDYSEGWDCRKTDFEFRGYDVFSNGVCSGVKCFTLWDVETGLVIREITPSADADPGASYVNILSCATEQDKEYKLSIEDYAGNTWVDTFGMRLDHTPPVMTGKYLEEEYRSERDIDGGIAYYNPESDIEATAEDPESDGVTSGMLTFYLTNYKKPSEEGYQTYLAVTSYPFFIKYLVPEGTEEDYYILIARDKAGNTLKRNIYPRNAVKNHVVRTIPYENYMEEYGWNPYVAE